MARCPVCTIRVGPCVDEHGAPMAQYHDARVRAEAKGRIDAMGEAERLRREAQAAVIRERAKQERSGR